MCVAGGTIKKLPPVSATLHEAYRQAAVVMCVMSVIQIFQSISQAVIKSLNKRTSKESVCADGGCTCKKSPVLFHLGT